MVQPATLLRKLFTCIQTDISFYNECHGNSDVDTLSVTLLKIIIMKILEEMNLTTQQNPVIIPPNCLVNYIRRLVMPTNYCNQIIVSSLHFLANLFLVLKYGAQLRYMQRLKMNYIWLKYYHIYMNEEIQLHICRVVIILRNVCLDVAEIKNTYFK